MSVENETAKLRDAQARVLLALRADFEFAFSERPALLDNAGGMEKKEILKMIDDRVNFLRGRVP